MQQRSSKLIDGSISLDVTFFMVIPASMSKNKKDALEGKKHAIKPDLSNLIKYLEDVAQNLIFRDDSAITNITARKIYDKNPRTEFSIKKEENGKKENSST